MKKKDLAKALSKRDKNIDKNIVEKKINVTKEEKKEDGLKDLNDMDLEIKNPLEESKQSIIRMNSLEE